VLRKRVAIVGGGYAGVKALDILARSGLCDVVLIDQHPYHYLQTEAYELIANECSMTRVTVDLIALCLSYGSHVSFIKDTITDIDIKANHIVGKNSGHNYDYVLICTGSRTAFHERCSGLREYSHGVKTLKSALAFKQQFEQRLYERMESEGGWCSEPFNIVIGGGGLSGVEIAAEMGHYVRNFHRDNTLTCDNIHIFLIIPHENVLEGMDPYLIRKSTKRLESLGVKIIQYSRITSVREHALILNESQELCFDFMIFTGGVVASTLTSSMDVMKNHKNQLIVDPFLRINGFENHFAAGDICELHDEKGRTVPPTAQSAEQSGVLAAQNILASIEGNPLHRCEIRMRGMMVALGGKYAAISILGWFRLSGMVGYWFKSAVMGIYRLILNRQCIRGLEHIPKIEKRCRFLF